VITAVRSVQRTMLAGAYVVGPVASSPDVDGWWLLHGEEGLGCHVAPR